MSENLPFFVALGFILTHELDAMRCHEWRVFPGLSLLREQHGSVVFTALHVPLFALLFLALLPGGSINQQFVLGFDVFLIIHVGLHLLALHHPKNEFCDPLSWTLILGAGVAGGVDLMLRL